MINSKAVRARLILYTILPLAVLGSATFPALCLYKNSQNMAWLLLFTLLTWSITVACTATRNRLARTIVPDYQFFAFKYSAPQQQWMQQRRGRAPKLKKIKVFALCAILLSPAILLVLWTESSHNSTNGVQNSTIATGALVGFLWGIVAGLYCSQISLESIEAYASHHAAHESRVTEAK